LRLRDLSCIDHRGEDLLLSRLRGVPVGERAVQRRSADKACEHRRLGEIEVGRLPVEVDLRGGRGADGAVAERHAVEIHLEDLVLRVAALDGEGEQRFGHLALERW
jgi:hypothetical protein